MKLISLLTLPVIALLATGCNEQNTTAHAPAIWEIETINAKAERINAGEIIPFYEQLKVEADSILLVEQNPSVVTKPTAPNSGNIHDYMSLSRYWWPNPDTEDSLPYIRKDGVSNPELRLYDRAQLSKLSESINTLSIVYYISGEQKYADKAISRLNTWFIDPATRMNPNFNYAQIRRGHNGDNGMHSGVLDGFSFVSMLDAISLLDIKGALPREVATALQEWFADLSVWLLTSENGIAESNGNNNHAIAYDTQVIRYAMYGGRDDIALEVINAFPERRLRAQIKPDGSMPAELARATAFFYTRYNIEHMLDICAMAEKLGVELYGASDRAIERAIDFMIPYSTDQASFPYKQIHSWQGVSESFARVVYRASKWGKESQYREYYQTNRAPEEEPLFEFLYL